MVEISVKHSRNKRLQNDLQLLFFEFNPDELDGVPKHGHKVAFQTYLEFWTVLVVKQRTTKLYIDYVTLKAKPHRKLQVG